MALILAEQTLLIALHDKKGHDTTPYAGQAGLAGALLLDLGRSELVQVADDGKVLLAVDGEPPSHPLLREAYEVVRSSDRARSARDWINRLQHQLRPLNRRLAEGLVAQGVLSRESSRVLGIFSTTRFPEADPGPERQLRQNLRDVLVIGREPTEQEALLVGLLAPLHLIPRTVPEHERKVAEQRAEKIAERGVAGTALGDTVRALKVAMVSSSVVAGAVAASV